MGMGPEARRKLDKTLAGEDDGMTDDEKLQLEESWGTSPDAQAAQAKLMEWAGGEG